MTDDPDPTIGVRSLHTSRESKAICNAVTALGSDAEWLRAEDTANTYVGPRQAFFQEFRPPEDEPHSDLPVYVVGDAVIAAMSRTAQGEE